MHAALTKRCYLGIRDLRVFSSTLRLRHATSTQNQLHVSLAKDKFKQRLEMYQWVNKVLYNSFLSSYEKNIPQQILIRYAQKENAIKLEKANQKISSKCAALKYFEDVEPAEPEELRKLEEQLRTVETEGPTQYPFKIYSNIDTKSNSHPNPERAPDGSEDKEYPSAETWVHSYGIADPTVPASKVPCGGCGALLHCRDTGIPGYIPSESFKKLTVKELRTQICQRCYYLKVHNAALNVNVSREDYPKVLEDIKKKKALVLLVVDLIDFPCSIWPGIAEIIGDSRPVILVGNKVDLLPRDSKKYLQHVKTCLHDVACSNGLSTTRIIDTALISATTGYGVEELITSIYCKWNMQGDIYLMGCTNVGKSTLFNVLLQTDLCKVQAVDLVHRATVSEWPGTTLSLLKFPVIKPSNWVKYLRAKRIDDWKEEEENERRIREFQLRTTKSPLFAQLIGRVGRSYTDSSKEEETEFLNDHAQDMFQINPKSVQPPRLTKEGDWDPEDAAFTKGRWCYDTPGTVNENQILDQFQLGELMEVIPKKLIWPRTYYVRLNHTVFVGGICRIDLVDGDYPVRFTVFTSDKLPITITETCDAEEVFMNGFGTPIMGVPRGDAERLSQFPPLQPNNEYEMIGESHKYSCGDIVISTTGWVAVTAASGARCKLVVHSPGGKGVYCRQPSLLPHTVNLKGRRIRGSYAYENHRLYIPTI